MVQVAQRITRKVARGLRAAGAATGPLRYQARSAVAVRMRAAHPAGEQRAQDGDGGTGEREQDQARAVVDSDGWT